MRTKHNVRHFRPELVVAPFVMRHLRAKGHPLLRQEIEPLVQAALFPERLKLFKTCRRLIDGFSAAFARYPDIATDVFQFVRELLGRPEYTFKGVRRGAVQMVKVAVWLRTHPTTTIKRKRRVVSDLQDGEIAQLLSRPGADISVAVVKRARQTAALADADWDLLLHPLWQAYMRTGIQTRPFKRLLATRAKGI